MIEALFTDTRFALRWLGKSPGFASVAIASLAIGIGFNTTLFAVTDALLFRPLSVMAPSRLVDVFTSASTGAANRFSTSSYLDYLDLKAQNRVFDDMAGYSPMFAALNLGDRSRLALGETVTGNYFRVLGVAAHRGRTLLPEDDAPDAPRVAMISYRYWSRELAALPTAVGGTLRIRGVPYTIVGIAPPSFTGMVPMLAPEIWVPVSVSLDVEPLGLHDVVPSPTGTTRLDRRGDRWLFIRARLQPGASIEQARANVELLSSRLAAAYPATNKDRLGAVKATSDVHVHPAADPVLVPVAAGLMATVGLVLLIACANVASMLLARASGRQREIGVRLAIGATRARLAQQLVTEALVMSLIGAAVGILLAWWVTRLAASVSLPLPVPLVFDLRLDTRVLVFTMAVSLFAGVAAGLAPALRASKIDMVADLRGEQTLARAGGRTWSERDVLVSGQIAVTGVLLVAAALLTRSLIAAQRTSVGFPIEHLAVLSMDTGMVRYSAEQSRQFYDTALQRVRTLPGVERAALATRVPFSLNGGRWEVWVPGRHQPGAPGESVEVTTVSADYFDTFGIRIVQGRSFTGDERPNTPFVAVVNEAFARRYGPGANAVGRTFRSRNSDGPVFEIIGVAADHKVRTVTEAPTPFVHVARTQRPNPYSFVIARTRGDAATLLRDMRRELLSIEPNLVFVENQTMEAEVGATLFPARAGAWLVGGVGAVAMMLAAVGLYGVIAYSVARRTREVGIRIALGARPASVLGLVMREGLLVTAAGLIAGCLLAIIAARAIAGALYGVGAADATAWAIAIVILVSVSLLANLIPASRAARVNPSIALRTE